MSTEAYATFSRACRALRDRGERTTFPAMSECARLALALETGDDAEAEAVADRLALDVASLTGEVDAKKGAAS
jgi:hypothetical protein